VSAHTRRNRRRLAFVAALVALALVVGLFTHWLGTRRTVRDVTAESVRMRAEIDRLEVSLEQAQRERAALPAAQRGHGPGGVRSDAERWFFEGPTAATVALDLITAADACGFGELSYEGEDAVVVSRFPPDPEDGAVPLPVSRPVAMVEWPVRIRMETTYASAIEFTRRLAAAEPAFAVDGLRLEVATDARGEIRDRVVVTGVLSGHWFREEVDGDAQ
jgi:hypothetical protein